MGATFLISLTNIQWKQIIVRIWLGHALYTFGRLWIGQGKHTISGNFSFVWPIYNSPENYITFYVVFCLYWILLSFGFGYETNQYCYPMGDRRARNSMLDKG